MKDRNKKVTIAVLVILGIGLIVSLWNASTYALFSSDIYGGNYETYTTGFLSIVANSKSDNISLTSALPMSDEEGKESTPYVFTIKNEGNLDYQFDVKLLSTSSNTFSPEYIKLQIDDGDVKTLSDISSIIKSDLVLLAGDSIDISIRIWLDENTPNTEVGKSFESKIVTDGQAIYTETNEDAITPLSDFTYYLGSEYATVDTIDYYYPGYDEILSTNCGSIALDSNEVLLVRYNGESKNVVVPDTYVVDGVTYNVTLLSWTVLYYIDEVNGERAFPSGVFYENLNIEKVILGNNIKVISDYSINTDFTTDIIIENDASYLFFRCTNLISVPSIPNSVTNMNSTFYGCTSLVNAPEIPNSVTNMNSTFYGCTSLVNAPEIPNSVIDLYQTFYGCTSLTGTVKINSSNVSDVYYIFYGTSLPITVQVPVGSTTYTNISALTTSNGMPSNVTLVTY